MYGLTEAYLSNISLLLSLELFDKFVVGGLGGGWVVLSDFSFKRGIRGC